MSLTAKRRAPSHTRKIQAGHHRHNKSYMKAYWPYLPMVAIVASGVFVNSLLASSEAVLGWQANYSSSALLSLTNSDRTKDNEGALNLNSELSSAAEAKANDMVSSNYWSHTSPSGKTAEDFIIASGYQFAVAGENLAYGFGSAASVNSAWMNSPGHKANILDTSYTDVGFGVAESPNYLGHGPKVIVVAEYAEPSTTGVLGLVNQPPPQSVSRLNALSSATATWPELALTAVITASMFLVVVRHGLGIKKLVLEGEEYIVNHPFFDIAVVLVATVATLLSHTSGLIG